MHVYSMAKIGSHSDGLNVEVKFHPGPTVIIASYLLYGI